MAREPLYELNRGSVGPLRFLERSSLPREEWALHQAGRPVATVASTLDGWLVTARLERWRAAVRRRPRRLGWQLELRRSKDAGRALYYRPYTVLAGGTLALAAGARYKLRGPLLLGDAWTVTSSRDGELVRITPRQLNTFGPDADPRMVLAIKATTERELLPLVCAACLAILIHTRQPGLGGPHP